jgi:uncharacterized membrane protein
LAEQDPELYGMLAYLFIWLGGAVVYVTRPDDDYARFHAMQSMMFFGAITALDLVLTLAGATIDAMMFLGIPAFLAWLFLMYKAFSRERYHIPVIGEYAEIFSK